MKKKLLIPTIMFPYLIVLVLVIYFILGNMFESFRAMFSNNINVIGTGLFAFLILAIFSNIVFITSSKFTEASKIIKAALIVKCIHIPTYILIFFFGLLLGLMFFMTIPLILFLVFLDIITLCLSNMISVYAIGRALKEEGCNLTVPLFISLVCQFIFCADVISIFVINKLIGRKK